MKKILAILVITVAFVVIESARDVNIWADINHAYSLAIRISILTGLSLYVKSIWPFLLFFAVFDPTVALFKGLNFFYIGETAIYDNILRILFWDWAGEISFTVESILAILFLYRNIKRK